MPALAVIYEHEEVLMDLNIVFRELSGWDFYHFDSLTGGLSDFKSNIKNYEISFIVVATPLKDAHTALLADIHAEFPYVKMLFYGQSLQNGTFERFEICAIQHCAVGQNRHDSLLRILRQLENQHWRKIPYDILGVKLKNLPPRAKRILRYIENMPIQKCTVEEISKVIRISQSHFRKEFRVYFGMNFRHFKQLLIGYYEDRLLFELNLRPGQIFELLNYKNLSAFSRSFHSRHGKTWQEMNRKNSEKKISKN